MPSKFFRNVLRKMTDAGLDFSPERLGDPYALKTDWTPLSPGGANFKTSKLKQTGSRVRFVKSAGMILFASIFLAIGLVALLFGFSWLLKVYPSDFLGIRLMAGAIPLVIGSVFISVGIAVLKAEDYAEFDLGLQTFKNRCGDTASFEDIHAVQIVREWVSGESSYSSYELNLVLTSGQRFNIIDHGNLTAIRKDANSLSVLIGKPLWDSTDPKYAVDSDVSEAA